METAQLFDIAVALVLVTLGFIGFLRGFIGAVMSFIGLVCSTYFAFEYFKEGAVIFLKYFPDVSEAIANIASFAIIFLVVAIVISLIARILIYFVKFAKLSGANHMGGMLIGIITGVALIVAAYGAIVLLAPRDGYMWTWMNDSVFMRLAETIWPHVHDFLVKYNIDPMQFVEKIRP